MRHVCSPACVKHLLALTMCKTKGSAPAFQIARHYSGLDLLVNLTGAVIFFGYCLCAYELSQGINKIFPVQSPNQSQQRIPSFILFPLN